MLSLLFCSETDQVHPGVMFISKLELISSIIELQFVLAPVDVKYLLIK